MDNDHEHTDLGVNQKDIYMGEGLPSTAPSKDEPEKVYPSFHYSGPKELHLPDEGKMEIHFCKTSETSRTRKDGSHWYECCIEVKCFGKVESEDGEEKEPKADEALDIIARALGKEREEY
jgi:hypothetical protein